jgi:hypothetical protein
MRLVLFAAGQQSMQHNFASVFKLWLQRQSDGYRVFPYVQVHEYSKDLPMAQRTGKLTFT